MEKDSSHNIYAASEQKPEQYVEQDEIAGNKDSFSKGPLFFRIGIVALILIVGAILVLQGHKRKDQVNRPEAEQEPTTQAAMSVEQFRRPAETNLTMPNTSFLLENRSEFTPREIPADGIRNLDVHWVRQAGWHIGQAQQAYRWEHWRKAVKEYRKAQQIMPSVEGLSQRLGLCHFWLKDYESARECFQKALGKEPHSPSLLNNLGLVCTSEEKYAEAENNFKKAIEVDPDYSPAYFNLGLMFYRKDDMNNCANYLREFLKFDSNNLDALHLFSLALMRAKRWDEAIVVLESSTLMLPNSAPLHFRYAEALSQGGDPKKAMSTLEKAVTLVDAKNALTWLSQGEYDSLCEREDYQKLVMKLRGAL